MSGSRAKKLRRELMATGVTIMRRGWRQLKRDWTQTPRPDRVRFDMAAAVASLRAGDEAHVRRWLRSLSDEQRAKLRKQVLKT